MFMVTWYQSSIIETEPYGPQSLNIFCRVFYNFFCIFYCCLVIVVPPFSPLLTPSHTPPLPQSIPPHCPCHESSIHIPWLAPFPSFHRYPLPPSPLVTVSLFIISKSWVLFCLLVCCVDQVPLIGEIIWYLSFTAWLISLSITLSSSIHAIVKGRSSFFLLHGT